MINQGILTEGRLSTVDVLLKVACFVKKVNIFFCKKNWSKLESTVLSLPLSKTFLDELTCCSENKSGCQAEVLSQFPSVLKTRDGVYRDSKSGDDGVGEDQVHHQVVEWCPDLNQGPMLLNFLRPWVTNVRNKLECLCPESLTSLV